MRFPSDPLQRRVAIGFSVAISFLSGVYFLVYRQREHVRQATAWVAHTHRIRTEIEAVGSSLNELESAQRGYLITGDTLFKQTATELRNKLAESIAQIERLTLDNPRQQAQLPALRTSVKKRLDILERVANLRDSAGFAAAQAKVMSLEGKLQMDRVLATLSALSGEEMRLLSERERIGRDSDRSYGQTLIVVGASALLLLGLSLVAIFREIRRRQELEREQALHKAHLMELTADLALSHRERTAHLEEARRAEAEFRQVLEKIPMCVMIRRRDTFIYANPFAAITLGYPNPSSMVPQKVLEFVHPDHHSNVTRRMEEPEKESLREIEAFKASGERILIQSTDAHIPITFDGGEAHLVAFRDVTEERRLERVLKEYADEMHSLSLADELTQLYNRRGFITLGDQHLKTARRARQPALILFIDLDGLKAINDGLGHDAGDEAIVATAEVLRAVFRDADIIGRLGGDEFVTLVGNCSEAEGPIKRLNERIDAYNATSGKKFKLSVSTGVAIFDPTYPEALETLLQRADSAMYEHKQARRVARG